MANPNYVRLSHRLSRGVCADVQGGSGWSISGLDVKEYPDDDPAAARFVRQKLNQGVLEPASKAEYEEVQDAREAVAEALSSEVEAVLATEGPTAGRRGWQEANVQKTIRKEQRKLAEAREAAVAEDEDDEGSRANRIKAQKKRAKSKAKSGSSSSEGSDD